MSSYIADMKDGSGNTVYPTASITQYTQTSFNGGAVGTLVINKIDFGTKALYVMNGTVSFPAKYAAQIVCTLPAGITTYNYIPIYYTQAANNDIALGADMGIDLGRSGDRQIKLYYKNGTSASPFQLHATWVA